MTDARDVRPGDVRQVRIGRIVVDAPPGTDRAALARELAASLPSAIGAAINASADSAVGRSGGAAAPPVDARAPTLTQQVAAAVAARVRGAAG